jgi:hypothetical protein
MSGGLCVIFEERELTLATFENALIWSFRGEANLDRIQRAREVHEMLAKEYPHGFGVMSIVSEQVPLVMSKEAREMGTSITRDFRDNYCGICEVVEGNGFRTFVARSINAGVRLVARPACPAKVFADVDTASRWLGALMAPGAGAEKMGEDLAAAARRICVFSKP